MPVSITPTQPLDERQLVFTSSQAARYLGVSLATVRRWTDAGHIDCYRTPGGQRRFSRDAAGRVRRLDAAHRRPPSVAPTVEHRRTREVA